MSAVQTTDITQRSKTDSKELQPVTDPNLGISMAMAKVGDSKSSLLMQALLALDEKYANSDSSKSAPKGKVDIDTVKSLSIPSLKSLSARGTMSKLRGLGRDRVTVKLFGQYTSAFISGANASLFSSQAISPINVADWSSYAALYDIARVKRVVVYVQPNASGPATVSGYWSLAWDPSNSAAYSSFTDTLTAQHHIGPVGYSSTTANGTATFTKTGFHEMKIGLPTPKEQIANNNLAAGIVGGGWIATSDTNYICGYLKSFQSALGAGVVSGLNVLVEYLVEFRART